MLLGLASTVILNSAFRGPHYHILLSPILDAPNLEDQVPVFIFSRDSVAQLYPQAPCSLFIAFYDSQGYGGGILTQLNSTPGPRYIAPARAAQITSLSLLPVLSLPGNNVSTELFPSNGCCTVT
jgi:hypothetical protein